MSENSTLNFKDTCNLPTTEFPIRAGLAAKEPEILAKWQQSQLYQAMKAKQATYSKTYLLHDGPPYPNGNIHMGHALNKVLKDIVVRSKLMAGYNSPYIPGWDCHGLPIEMQVLKELKKNNQEDKKADIAWFRDRCRQFAADYVDVQRDEFIRLGVLGEWENPYLTLDPVYEAKTIELFGNMAKNGLVYRGRKPIHWCAHCETALAEAEIEYADHRSPSIYFTFRVTADNAALHALTGGLDTYVMVWTTTPWTLPANVAIAAHPRFQYTVLNHQNKCYILVDELYEKITQKLGWQDTAVLGHISGDALNGIETRHPFLDRSSPLVLADYVTNEDGTGFVHTAPGHGQEDYVTGMKYNLPMVMPVDDQGKFTNEVPEAWRGLQVFDANKPICQHMEETGTLLKLEMIKHSYPHCWRCKNPVIFRATEQWFIAMDTPMTNDGRTLREKALEAIKNTTWYPGWGEKRITGMIENRPDWCISRQRFWGIPIPVFICKDCNHAEMTGIFNNAIVDMVKVEGTVAWFQKDPSEILPAGTTCTACGGTHFKKETDILDVWFESGASWGAVLETRDGVSFPADLYLEGSDQHRGWFHSSLLVGIGSHNAAPYREVLTHGFMVDEKGQKMSKSMGNVIAPQKVIDQMGSDVLRWWISGTDFKNDISISQNILKQSQDTFSKVRNTMRFLLSNLYDFNAATDLVAPAALNEVDQWALGQLNQLVARVRTCYADFDFHLVSIGIHDFCAVTLSSLYLDMVKDRLYCGAPASPERRSTQTALYHILDALIRMAAPILVFTAEDAYSYFNKPDKQTSVHLEQLPEVNDAFENAALLTKWSEMLEIRNAVYQKLEELRNQKLVRSFMEAKVVLTLPQDIRFNDWESFLITSQAEIKTGTALQVEVSVAEGEKCARCWKILPLTDSVCARCHQVLHA